jgi:hypothetical protein
VIYEPISEDEAAKAVENLQEQIENWLDNNGKVLLQMAKKDIRKHVAESLKSPFGQFYILSKIHKGKKEGSCPTRSVCSDVSSIPHGLGKWVIKQLMPITRTQQSYFKDSFCTKGFAQ